MGTHDERVCASCGRAFAWRRSSARDWDQVRYCSKACRRRRVRPEDRALEAAIRDLLAERARTATICPSEAARRVAGEEDETAWRALLEPARRAARRLVAAGEVELLQRGRVVDPSSFRGPVRIRRAGGR